MKSDLKIKLHELLGEEVIKPDYPLTVFYENTYIQTKSGKVYFLKGGTKGRMYICEKNGINEIRKTGIFKLPEVFFAEDDFLVSTYVEISTPSRSFYSRFGKQLAQMHRFQSDKFGFYENNFIGRNEQINIPEKEEEHDWVAFYFNKRLLYQYKLAESNGYATSELRRGISKLESKIEEILEGSEEPPCLLHGALWNGNFLCNQDDEAVLIDPAVYYGHREAEMSMTKLFGGLPKSFYDAYQAENPLPEGWQYREGIYKLYHILNHLNIFGRVYLEGSESIINSYLK